MSQLLIHAHEWVVVCDGAKALVLENTGDAKFPNLKTIEHFEQKDLATHELGADSPGRTFSPAGHGARSSVEQTDWHDQTERAFLLQLVKHLDAVSAADIVGVNIPTGIPLVYELNEKLSPIRHYYLGGAARVQKAMRAAAGPKSVKHQ